MINEQYIKPTHDNCMGARGIRLFKCIKCGEKGVNYANGTDVCDECCKKDNICKVCGKKLELNNNNKQIKVFLGGTCNDSNWRQDLINKLDDRVVDYFNPVVDDWTPECMKEELRQRELCDYCLYVITPRITGVYSIAEVVDDSNKRPNKTIFCYLSEDGNFNQEFTDGQKRSLDQVAKMVKNNGGKAFSSLEEIAEYLNAVGEIKRVLPRVGQDVIESIINLATAEAKYKEELAIAEAKAMSSILNVFDRDIEQYLKMKQLDGIVEMTIGVDKR